MDFFMGNGVGSMALAAIAVAVIFMYFAMGLSMMLGIGEYEQLPESNLAMEMRKVHGMYMGRFSAFGLIVSVRCRRIACMIFMKPAAYTAWSDT